MNSNDIDESVRRVNEQSGVEIKAKLKRGTDTRDQDTLVIKARGSDAQEATEQFDDALSNICGWANGLRGVQPETDYDGGSDQ